MTEAKRRKDEKHIQTCKGKIREKSKSQVFGEKIETNILKDILTKPAGSMGNQRCC